MKKTNYFKFSQVIKYFIKFLGQNTYILIEYLFKLLQTLKIIKKSINFYI